MSIATITSAPSELPHGHAIWIGPREPQPWHPWFSELSCADEASRQGNNSTMIVLALPAEEQDAALRLLRGNSATALSLIFVLHESALSPFLANGVFDSQFREHCTEHEQRLEQMRLAHGDDPEFKLLCWLWLTDSALAPHAVPSRPELYDYPLLRAWGMDSQEVFAWLNSLKQKGWIEPKRLYNRTRYCPHCYSGHLNYIDVCPRCRSLDIEHRSSLHCFNCGHVGAKEDFLRSGNLGCPNCLTQLRHIGVDYDRPIENQGCNSCDHLFVEASVEAHCLHCSTPSGLDRLKVRNIHSFRLTPAGRALVRQGALQNLFQMVPGERMSQGQFLWLVNWQNQLAQRHGHHHSLMSIEMLNLDAFLKAEGETRGFARLDAMMERLKGLIRVTDACSNYTAQGLLLFLPYTEVSHVQVVADKLREMEELQEGSRIEVRLRALSLPAETGPAIDEWLAQALAGAPQL
ncbi:hypothetical protein [Shewanella khirikhana]|uniref:Thaumarchaeal output domain-containing protein n=1 Tax=Shewanella khirikhana TaxID=1965282 RepID=A0ABN5TXD1_9GAMM|nr:hypothetical protein [Shewanella khirikhana]AZQ12127.1 hypothetical protein STH12_03063 [Shewanella khirikhana]